MQMYETTKQLIGKINNYRALSVFGDELEGIIKDKRKEWSKALRGCDKQRKEMLHKATNMAQEPLVEMFWFYGLTDYQRDCLRQKFNLEALYKRYKSGNFKKNDIDIEKARQFPISELAGVSGNKKRVSISCPLHEDKTPSCVIYNDTNSWYCFSCQAGSDPISWVQEVEGLSFIDAVRRLN